MRRISCGRNGLPVLHKLGLPVLHELGLPVLDRAKAQIANINKRVMQSTHILQLQIDHAEPLLNDDEVEFPRAKPSSSWIVQFFMKLLRPNQPPHLPLK